jgi:uncharacterized membrane protein
MSDTISPSDSRRAVRAYAALLAVASLALVLSCAVVHGVGRWEVVLALAVVAYVAESRTVRISTRVELSGSLIPLVMAAVLFGPAAGAIVGLGAMLSDRRGPVERFVIFTSGRALAGACAGLAAMTVTDVGLGHLFAATCVAATAASAVEFCVTAITLWLRHRSSPVELWRQVRVHALITVSLCAPVGALFAYAYGGSGIWVLAFFAIPVAATRYAFGMHAPKEHLIGALERANADLESANSQLRRINMSFAEALVKAIDGRDAYTAGHSKAVAEYSRDIARELGLSREDAARIHLCGLVHDIGKIGVRAEVLEKQAALDDGEWEEMRRHSAIGESILLEVPGYADMAEVVRSHHERWDGAGYPDKLSGEAIPRLARVIAVADSYNAMTSNRPYRGGMSPERAIEQLILGKGSQYEAAPVDAFLRVLDRAPGWYRRGQFTPDADGLAAVESMGYPAGVVPRAAA